MSEWSFTRKVESLYIFVYCVSNKVLTNCHHSPNILYQDLLQQNLFHLANRIMRLSVNYFRKLQKENVNIVLFITVETLLNVEYSMQFHSTCISYANFYINGIYLTFFNIHTTLLLTFGLPQ
jgi:hypothetical protein